MNKNINRIIIDINNDGWVDIKSEDLNIIYANGDGGHGLQCYYAGGTKRYDEILQQLDEITNRIKRLNYLIDDI